MAGNPVNAPTNAYATIDFMRFLAALAVLWNHAWGMFTPFFEPSFNAWRPVYWTAGFGADAVRIFFVISGYWITATILRKVNSGGWTWRNYLIDRMSRLWIVLIPALVIGLILDGSGRFILNLPRYSDFDFITANDIDLAGAIQPESFFGSMVFMQNIYVPPFGSNAPLWSLTNEFWYYIWFPSLLLLFRGKLSILTLVTLVTMVLFTRSNVTEGFLIWLLGSLVYIVTNRIGERWRATKAPVRQITTGLAFLVFIASIVVTRVWPSTWLIDGLVVGVGFCLLLGTVIVLDMGLPKILHPLSVYGAKASFSLYLVHFPILLFLASTLVGGRVFTPGWEALIIALGMTVLLVGIGWLFSLLTEQHTNAVRKRFTALLAPRARPVAGA